MKYEAVVSIREQVMACTFESDTKLRTGNVIEIGPHSARVAGRHYLPEEDTYVLILTELDGDPAQLAASGWRAIGRLGGELAISTNGLAPQAARIHDALPSASPLRHHPPGRRQEIG